MSLHFSRKSLLLLFLVTCLPGHINYRMRSFHSLTSEFAIQFHVHQSNPYPRTQCMPALLVVKLSYFNKAKHTIQSTGFKCARLLSTEKSRTTLTVLSDAIQSLTENKLWGNIS